MRQNGFSFVELAIATGIFVAASLGITKIMFQVSQGIDTLQVSEAAFSALQQKLSDLSCAPAADAGLTHYRSVVNDKGGSIKAGEAGNFGARLQLRWQVEQLLIQRDASGELETRIASGTDDALKQVAISVTTDSGGSRRISATIRRPELGSVKDVWQLNQAATP